PPGGPPQAQSREAHHLRMRHRPRRRGLVPEPGSLLRVRVPVRHLRRRERVPVPLGTRVRQPGVRRGGGDDLLHRVLGGRAALRLAQGGTAMGLITEKTPLAKVQPVKFILNWGRRYSLWVMNFGLACCAIEFIAASTAKNDFIRLGVIPFAHGPRQADLLVVACTLTDKMAPVIKRLYDQMP